VGWGRWRVGRDIQRIMVQGGYVGEEGWGEDFVVMGEE